MCVYVYACVFPGEMIGNQNVVLMSYGVCVCARVTAGRPVNSTRCVTTVSVHVLWCGQLWLSG